MADSSGIMENLENSSEHNLTMDSDFENTEEETASTASEILLNVAELAGNVRAYEYINGRRYHEGIGNGAYYLPQDAKEQGRLDLVHYIFLALMQGKLHLAPIRKEDLKMVLDVGTGTGIWAIEFAEEYPAAQIIGTDISAIQPGWVLPQLTFELFDMESPWGELYKPDTFDYIHVRAMCGIFRDWDAFLLQAMRHTVPGGYVEIQDWGHECFHTSGCIPEGSALAAFQSFCVSAGDLAGRPLQVARHMKERMISLGFEDVQESVYIFPFGTWPKNKQMKELGRISQVSLAATLEAYGFSLFSRYHNMDMGTIRKMCDEALQDVKTTKGYYCDVFVIHGRKPLNWKG